LENIFWLRHTRAGVYDYFKKPQIVDEFPVQHHDGPFFFPKVGKNVKGMFMDSSCHSISLGDFDIPNILVYSGHSNSGLHYNSGSPGS
jgi:hypothetical protein